MNLCSRIQHPRSGTFSCLTIFSFSSTSSSSSSSSLQLLIAGDTDGLAHFFNLKTMKLVALLNINDQTIINSKSSSSLSAGNLFLPVPRSPQGILALGVEKIGKDSDDNLVFWAQSRAMQVFVFDLKKDILGIEMDNEDDDCEDDDDEQNQSSQQLQQNHHHQIPVVAVLGPFNNFSFAPSLCCQYMMADDFDDDAIDDEHEEQQDVSQRQKAMTSVLIFLCPHELTHHHHTSQQPVTDVGESSSSSSVTNGALYYSVIGENSLMKMMSSKSATARELHVAMRGNGELLFAQSSTSSSNHHYTLPPKLGQLMMLEKVEHNDQKNNIHHQHHHRFVASFESGDVILFELHPISISKAKFYESQISIRVLAKIKVAAEPIMSLVAASSMMPDIQHQQQERIQILCGSAEGNLVLLNFVMNGKSVELRETVSEKIGETGIGQLVPIRSTENENKPVCVECFLWNGERRTIQLICLSCKNDDNDNINAVKDEMKFAMEVSNPHDDSLNGIVVSSVCASDSARVIQIVSAMCSDSEVRKLGLKVVADYKRRRGEKQDKQNWGGGVSVFAIAKKGGEITLFLRSDE